MTEMKKPKRKKSEYKEGFEDGLEEAYDFLYTKVGSAETVGGILSRYREMVNKVLTEIRG